MGSSLAAIDRASQRRSPTLSTLSGNLPAATQGFTRLLVAGTLRNRAATSCRRASREADDRADPTTHERADAREQDAVRFSVRLPWPSTGGLRQTQQASDPPGIWLDVLPLRRPGVVRPR